MRGPGHLSGLAAVQQQAQGGNQGFAFSLALVCDSISENYLLTKEFRPVSWLGKLNLDFIPSPPLLPAIIFLGSVTRLTACRSHDFPGTWGGGHSNSTEQGTLCNVVNSLYGVEGALIGKGVGTSVNS